MKKTLKNGIEVTGKPWEGYGKERIYFALDLGDSAGSGSKNKNVCWDITKQEWISCSYEWEPDNATWENVRDQLYVAFGKEMGLPKEQKKC